MRISGSILAVRDNYMEYAKQLKYANVDALHVDIFQNSSKFKLKQICDFDDTYLPLDIHLIYEVVSDKDIDIINNSRASFVNIEYENLLYKDSIPYLKKNINANFGLAYTIETPMSIIEKNLQYCSQVLFMCSEPGVSGAEFNEYNYGRIEDFHRIHPGVKIVVDGGIDKVRIKRMSQIGVYMAVSGSYLCRDINQIGINAYLLKYGDDESVTVDQRMIPLNMLPIVKDEDDFMTIIDVMNRHRLGVVFVADGGKMNGIVSDGDIRRGFVKYQRNIFEKQARDLMNSEPYSVESGVLFQDMYVDLSSKMKGIDVIPILKNRHLLGAVDLRRGILY